MPARRHELRLFSLVSSLLGNYGLVHPTIAHLPEQLVEGSRGGADAGEWFPGQEVTRHEAHDRRTFPSFCIARQVERLLTWV